jgi:hypothetical protein
MSENQKQTIKDLGKILLGLIFIGTFVLLAMEFGS